MKERPILMTPENAQKVFDGAKTQTRRILKPQPKVVHGWNGEWLQTNQIFRDGAAGLRCPYGLVGDRLWIREKHWRVEIEGGGIGNGFLVFDNEWAKGMPEPIEERPWLDDCDKWGARPSIHMPRWACRTVVELVAVGVERLQDIQEEDAKAEGCIAVLREQDEPAEIGGDKGFASYRDSFVKLWESINGTGSWALNPWVWVLTMRRVTS